MSTALRVVSFLCLFACVSAQAPVLPQCAQGCANEAAIQVGCSLCAPRFHPPFSLAYMRLVVNAYSQVQPRMLVQDGVHVHRRSVLENDLMFHDGAGVVCAEFVLRYLYYLACPPIPASRFQLTAFLGAGSSPSSTPPASSTSAPLSMSSSTVVPPFSPPLSLPSSTSGIGSSTASATAPPSVSISGSGSGSSSAPSSTSSIGVASRPGTAVSIALGAGIFVGLVVVAG
ncbi:hypothetical protein B0H11DRAFT_2028428 [Mycena galericulata]|nr:hypothetical protein B0H11DRAFT_2028428 [Mycena galericulata]